MTFSFLSKRVSSGGHLLEVRGESPRFAKTKGWKENAASYQVHSALLDAVVGNPSLAKQQTEEALKLSDNKYVEAVSALVLALAGDSARAERQADDLARLYPENTSLQFQYLPMVRGTVALQRRETAKALQAFAAGAPSGFQNVARSANVVSSELVSCRLEVKIEN